MIIREVFLKEVTGLRSILKFNKFEVGDKIIFNTINKISKILFEKIQKEIDTASLKEIKENLSPKVKVESIGNRDYNTAKVTINLIFIEKFSKI